jgi:hypothetical protein
MVVSALAMQTDARTQGWWIRANWTTEAEDPPHLSQPPLQLPLRQAALGRASFPQIGTANPVECVIASPRPNAGRRNASCRPLTQRSTRARAHLHLRPTTPQSSVPTLKERPGEFGVTSLTPTSTTPPPLSSNQSVTPLSRWHSATCHPLLTSAGSSSNTTPPSRPLSLCPESR